MSTETVRPEWVRQSGYEDIIYEKWDGIARITINRPEVRNAFRPLTVREMQNAFNDARDDADVGGGDAVVDEGSDDEGDGAGFSGVCFGGVFGDGVFVEAGAGGVDDVEDDLGAGRRRRSRRRQRRRRHRRMRRQPPAVPGARRETHDLFVHAVLHREHVADRALRVGLAEVGEDRRRQPGLLRRRRADSGRAPLFSRASSGHRRKAGRHRHGIGR